jgi:hypothetical protein
MSVDAHKIMAENIADDVFDAYNESSTITKTIDWMFVGDDGECLDGEVQYTAKFVGGGYTVVPDSIEPIYDEFATANALAKIDDKALESIIEDEYNDWFDRASGV